MNGIVITITLNVEWPFKIVTTIIRYIKNYSLLRRIILLIRSAAKTKIANLMA